MSSGPRPCAGSAEHFDSVDGKAQLCDLLDHQLCVSFYLLLRRSMNQLVINVGRDCPQPLPALQHHFHMSIDNEFPNWR